MCIVWVRTLSILAHLPAIASGGVLNSAFCLPRPRPMSLACCSRHTARSLARCPRHVWHMVATDEKYLYFFRNRLNHKSHKRSCDWTERWNWCLRHKPLKKNIGNSVYSLAKSVWIELRIPRWSGPSSPTDKNTWTYPSGTRCCLMRAAHGVNNLESGLGSEFAYNQELYHQTTARTGQTYNITRLTVTALR